MQKNKGFTLIELMVTIAVLAIIATMAAPSMNNMVANQSLNSSVRTLMDTLAQGRSQAILLRREVTITLNSSHNNTATAFYWKPRTGNALTAPVRLPAIIFMADGTMKDNVLNTRFAETNFVICNTKIHRSKSINLTRFGTATLGPEGTC
ncbi:MAG TPA: prepilin-type N-terminal cleavage/methylation domain-containing protein [Acinetobacter lwoffii]|uniref:Prepilin-type N-terminal cleavage/methylation domain-containing protein n=1 Tax=Acinetobacter lwoffii TaxID=28090 RepID=A0A9D2ZXV0_ACILW|nr:prepilin-type N-terminal cleavage/methylation domain-containing protein [Acinetobacter lwoffii]